MDFCVKLWINTQTFYKQVLCKKVSFIGNLEKQIGELDTERKSIDNKRRRAKTEAETKEYYAQIRGISAQMKPIRENLKLAKTTLETVPKVQRVLDIERKMESKIKEKKKKSGNEGGSHRA